MFGLFKGKSASKPAHLSDVSEQTGPEPVTRPGKMSQSDEKRVYAHNPSIVDYLPWAEFLDEEQCLLLDDGISGPSG